MDCEDVSIAGMTCRTYDFDRDPIGAIGLALANAEYERRGGFTRPLERVDDRYDASTLRGIAIATLKIFPALNQSERLNSRDYKRKLGQIRKSGYELPDYSHLNTKDLSQLYNDVREDVQRRVRVSCPEVFAEIDEINRRRAREDELMR